MHTAMGLRDRAILLLLATYGVRAGEIVLLRLEDVDWRNEVIGFRRSKNGRPLRFPLTQAVGEAILGYLRGGRPSVRARELFFFLSLALVFGPLGSLLVVGCQ